jgi:hypothetical protein
LVRVAGACTLCFTFGHGSEYATGRATVPPRHISN